MENENAIAIAVLKERANGHDKQFKIHQKLINKQSAILANISKSLLQIKWLAIGAAIFWILNAMGLVDAAKTFLKII